jgi:hypothetical protein
VTTEAQQTGMAPAGWYADGTTEGMQRYWDGQQWTPHFAPLVGAADNGPVATTGDWVGGVILSVLFPIVGLIAGLVYVAKGGERAKCGWTLVGISLAMGVVYWLLVTQGADPQAR